MDATILSSKSLTLFMCYDGTVALYAVNSHIRGVLVIAQMVWVTFQNVGTVYYRPIGIYATLLV